MTARLEAVEPEVDIYLMKPHLNEGEKHSVFPLPYKLTPTSPNPSILGSRKFHFYTENVPYSGVILTPNEIGIGCLINVGTNFSGQLRPGETMIVGNLKIIGE